MRNRTVLVMATAMLLTLAGCGSSKHAGTGTKTPATLATTQPSRAVRATVDAWGKADTPQAICALMSTGFKLGLAHALHRNPAHCTSSARKALGPFKRQIARIISTATVGGQTRALVSFSGGKPVALFLVPECGRLKVNSINAYEPNPPPASHC